MDLGGMLEELEVLALESGLFKRYKNLVDIMFVLGYYTIWGYRLGR